MKNVHTAFRSSSSRQQVVCTELEIMNIYWKWNILRILGVLRSIIKNKSRVLLYKYINREFGAFVDNLMFFLKFQNHDKRSGHVSVKSNVNIELSDKSWCQCPPTSANGTAAYLQISLRCFCLCKPLCKPLPVQLLLLMVCNWTDGMHAVTDVCSVLCCRFVLLLFSACTWKRTTQPSTIYYREEKNNNSFLKIILFF